METIYKIMEEIVAKPCVYKPYRCAEFTKKHHATFNPVPPSYSKKQNNEQTNVKRRICSRRKNTPGNV